VAVARRSRRCWGGEAEDPSWLDEAGQDEPFPVGLEQAGVEGVDLVPLLAAAKVIHGDVPQVVSR